MSVKVVSFTERQLNHGAESVIGMGSGVQEVIDEDEVQPRRLGKSDRAIKQFSRGSLRAETNQYGTKGRTFQLEPRLKAISSDFAYPETIRTAKHPLQDFWTYDGAQPTLAATGKVATSREQVMPDRRVTEQDFVEWQRVGSKKGWMFNRQKGPGGKGENTPSFTSDGWPERIKDHRWAPLPRSAEKQTLATREFPRIDTENNARGIGVTGPGSGNGGMAGGYHEITQSRLNKLALPMAKFNHTGTRLLGTGREDGSTPSHGAGGRRSGYESVYPTRPAFFERRAIGLTHFSGR